MDEIIPIFNRESNKLPVLASVKCKALNRNDPSSNRQTTTLTSVSNPGTSSDQVLTMCARCEIHANRERSHAGSDLPGSEMISQFSHRATIDLVLSSIYFFSSLFSATFYHTESARGKHQEPSRVWLQKSCCC